MSKQRGKPLLAFFLLAAFLGCPGERGSGEAPKSPGIEEFSLPEEIAGLSTLEELAEAERSRGFIPGMALAESILRERNGDYGGAVIAVYKELSWSYGYGGTMTRESLKAALDALLDQYTREEPVQVPEQTQELVILAARGVLAFLDGRWTEAGEILESLCTGEEEPDAFSQWMRMVCALEGGTGSPRIRSAYGAIQARYETYPEYWYRAARYGSVGLTGEYAERCINLAPRGPFAEECRVILAGLAGLSAENSAGIKSRAEIEELITQSASSADPKFLADLFPLLALPDNPYTLYAVGALRVLAADSRFKDYFIQEASRRTGRLAERLQYISRG
ncbi:MAG: hypothetical protein LBP32_05295 [Spirochaetaceae bacterium]|nr:hypothetical protein [Spirochaetaceae bacterium]